MKKILKIFIMSAIVCFSLTFTLVIINLIMKVFIGIKYYFMLFNAMTIVLTIGLILYNSKKIFSNKKKIHKATSTHKVVRKATKETSEIRRRKIS